MKLSKMRRSFFQAPLHVLSSFLRSRLSDDLRSKYGKRSLRVRKGDTVKVQRGEYKGIEGKVTSVDIRSGKVALEGITREKIAGGTVPARIHASKVMITSLNLDDKWRKQKLEELSAKAQEVTKK